MHQICERLKSLLICRTREKRNKGKIFEDRAVKFLKKKGYRIIERNFRTYRGEIDIIAKKNDTFCFIEVRGREKKHWVNPTATVDRKKQKKIATTARYYLHRKGIKEKKVRFDVVGISEGDIELIQGGFEADF